MILQMTRASPLSFAEFAILSPMSKTDAHSLDPIPDEQFLETHDAAEGKPAGVRFLAFNTIIDIEALSLIHIFQLAVLHDLGVHISHEPHDLVHVLVEKVPLDADELGFHAVSYTHLSRP